MRTQLTFKEFLAEVMMDVDLNDPAGAVKQVRDASRMGPQKAARQQMVKANAEREMADETNDRDPTTRQELALKQRLAQLQRRKEQQKQQQQQQQAPY